MNRRKIIFGAASIIAGGSAAIGTSAFSSVWASRAVTIDTVDDADSLLRLDPADDDYPNSAYAIDSDGVIEIDITDTGDGFDGEGVSPFATTTIEEVFPIENQGTQDVQISITSEELSEDSSFELFATPAPDSDDDFDRTNLLKQTGDLPIVGPGESIAVGLEIDATGDDEELNELDSLLDDLHITVQATTEGVNES